MIKNNPFLTYNGCEKCDNKAAYKTNSVHCHSPFHYHVRNKLAAKFGRMEYFSFDTGKNYHLCKEFKFQNSRATALFTKTQQRCRSHLPLPGSSTVSSTKRANFTHNPLATSAAD